ncbi:hypothetical protein [Streptomyces monomycini]|uniref:hypothetical protein n=1 Tax=Streptomyces monomycini TaxID=371720 RepID=UPI001EECD128|nr:hypothetical protein [Streptomyces monomycini]
MPDRWRQAAYVLIVVALAGALAYGVARPRAALVADTCSNHCGAIQGLVEVQEFDLVGLGWTYLLCRSCATRAPWSFTEAEWEQLVATCGRRPT